MEIKDDDPYSLYVQFEEGYRQEIVNNVPEGERGAYLSILTIMSRDEFMNDFQSKSSREQAELLGKWTCGFAAWLNEQVALARLGYSRFLKTSSRRAA